MPAFSASAIFAICPYIEYYVKRISKGSNVVFRAPKVMQLKRDSLKVGGGLTNVNYSDTRSHGCELTKLSEL